MTLMDFAAYLILAVYCTGLIVLLAFSLIQLHLLIRYSRKRVHSPELELHTPDDLLPFVTVQLPVYNEEYVAARLIENIMNLDYPKPRFEVQILDDSTDNTGAIISGLISRYVSLGYNIHHITRARREGYKAGALEYGLTLARGELIAIFDADFLPHRDFLRKTIPQFDDPTVGVVQTRWEHINEDYSLITRVQAFQLNVHFSIEQIGRQEADVMLQFNGTAGVWRRKAINDAGGWQPDTLTEDLDLSYRAQLRGWKIRYLGNIGAPAELPAEMNGLKSQQYRWMKGGAETAKKLLPKIWRAPIPLKTKIHATGHLLSSSVFVMILLISVSSVPLLFVLKPMKIDPGYFAIFLVAWIIVAVVFYVGNARTFWTNMPTGKRILRFISLFPMFLSLSMGLSLHNSLAVIEGFRGKRSPFVRTPKFNIRSVKDSISYSRYLPARIHPTAIFEGILAIYFSAGIAAAFVLKDPTFILFHLLLAFGFGSICYFSIRHFRAHS